MKNGNKIHLILGLITRKTGNPREHRERNWTWNDIVSKMPLWKKIWFMWFPNRDEVAGLCDRIVNDKIVDLINDSYSDVGVSISDPVRLENSKKAHRSNRYKEPREWWQILLQYLAVIVPLIIATPSLISAIDNRKAPILRKSLDKEVQRIDSLQSELKRYSKALSSCLDSLKTEKNSRDSLSKVK